MASTSFFTGSDHNRNNQQQDLQTPTRPRRKSSKSSEINKKKAPRRGMGVEKLERLRNNDKTSSSSVPYAFIPTAFAADPFGNGTMSFSKYGGMGAVDHGGGGGSLSLMTAMVDMTATGGRSFCPNGQGAKEVSKELPSIPNLMQCDYCADCFKKKRNVRYPCNRMVFDGVNPSFHDTPQGTAKVVALHRTKASSTMGVENQVVMEYDFFSEGKKCAERSKTHDELMMMMKLDGRSGSSEQASAATAMAMVVQGGSGSGGGGEASCLTTTTATDASTYIDLSLKLSY